MATTILSYAGLEIPENMDGENLLPLISQENGIGRESIALFNMWGNDEIRRKYDEHYNQLVNNVVDYNNYEKYRVLFNRKATLEEKKPFLKGTYKEELKRGKHKGYKIR